MGSEKGVDTVCDTPERRSIGSMRIGTLAPLQHPKPDYFHSASSHLTDVRCLCASGISDFLGSACFSASYVSREAPEKGLLTLPTGMQIQIADDTEVQDGLRSTLSSHDRMRGVMQ